ncbi:MAG: hypothetical protein WC359_15530 [Dehalococcoidia bacterium]|jgi:hypothetical protein
MTPLDGSAIDMYRRYTTAELAAMPNTAEMEDREGYIWHVHPENERHYWHHGGVGYVTPNWKLARRLLRRIA